ncbi:effector-associated constant component EACC1 [Streptomyces cavernae]|uniref:effector-associated constant component EACC1 n=1 Tax=Streptomyces cavernae TaxID=2259034 RepID=UPI000FEBE164|nr:hypothetical protein [Streptomyces cavernae]
MEFLISVDGVDTADSLLGWLRSEGNQGVEVTPVGHASQDVPGLGHQSQEAPGVGDAPQEVLGVRLSGGTQLVPLVQALSTWVRARNAGTTVTVRTPSGGELVLTPAGVDSAELQREVAQLAQRLAASDGPYSGGPVRPADSPTTPPPSGSPSPYGHTPPGPWLPSADDWPATSHTPPGPVLDPGDDWPDKQEP